MSPPEAVDPSLLAAQQALQKNAAKLTPVARAVLEDNLSQVEALLQGGADLGATGPKVPSALGVAVLFRRQQMTQLLLNVGANPNESDGALGHWAALRGDTETLQSLLDHGATVDAADKRGRTALGFAAHAGQTEVVRLLLARGAAVDHKASNGSTPLQLAADLGHESTVTALITAGADVHGTYGEGSSAISLAAGRGHVAVVRTLWEAGAGRESEPDRRTPLVSAAEQGRVEALQYLLGAGADPSGISRSGWTPLILATYHGHAEVLRLLIAAGADVNARDAKGRTALMWSSWRQFRRCYELLLAAGADSTLQAPADITPHAAPPVPRIMRSSGLPEDGPILRVLARAAAWWGKKRVIMGVPVTVKDLDGKEAQVFSVLERALQLLEKHAPSELGRIRRAFSRIIVAEVPFFQAAYFNTHAWCVVNWDPKKPAPSPTQVAALLSHEATHHRLGLLGFGYREAERVRVERACSRAALRLSRRLPSRDAGIGVLRSHLHWIAPDALGDERQLQAGLAALKKEGASRLQLWVANWFGRRLQRKRRKQMGDGA